MAITNREIRLAARSVGMPKESDFELVESPVPEPREGEVLVRNLYMSVDPYLRMRLTGIDALSGAFEVGQTLRGAAVGRVEASQHSDWRAGEYVSSRLGWREWFAARPERLLKVEAEAAPLSYYLGLLGMPGLTAYVGLFDMGQPKAGETVYVSAAAGAVGSIAGGLAKAHGCRVVGSAGSDEKVRVLLEDLGFDAAFNYRSEGLEAGLARTCPDGVDVYFDNVGGDHLQVALGHMRRLGRVAACGNISEHGERRGGVANQLSQIERQRLTIRGFIVSDHAARLPAFMWHVTSLWRAGRIRYLENVVDGLERAPAALIALLRSEYTGKVVIRLEAEGG